MTYGCGATGHQSCPIFRILAYFPHTKSLQCTFRWPAYSPGVTSQNDSDFSVWQSKVQRGAFRHRRFPATSGRGAGDPKLAQIFTYGKWLYPYWMQLHGASDLDQQRCLKTRNSKDGCAFPSNIFAATILPKSPKTQFWGTFQCKTYYTDSSP